MLVNAVAGLQAAGHLERDLMRSYGASWWQTLIKLRLPAAMPSSSTPSRSTRLSP